MIRKIISCGMTGAELAALDIAIKLGIPHGGWTTRGKRNEAGRLNDTYQLRPTQALGFEVAQEKNVIDSDGTLVITRGEQTSLTTYAVKLALKHHRQFLHMDLKQYSLFEAASLVSSWMSQKQIRVVYVTGLIDREDPTIYQKTRKLLETAFYLGFVKTDTPSVVSFSPEGQSGRNFPTTVDDSVEQLKAVMSLKDKSIMANIQPEEIDHLNSSLSEYIKQNHGLYAGNLQLIESCAEVGGIEQPLVDEACAIILRALWEDLRKSHKLRLVK